VLTADRSDRFSQGDNRPRLREVQAFNHSSGNA
jgi:hypothetical protein